MPLCWAAAVALCLRALPRPGRLELALVSGLTLFAGWIALSTAWSRQPAQSVLELERALVYPAGVLAVLVLARRAGTARVLGGVLGGIVPVCAYALATRVFPERLGSFDSVAVYRLSQPVTYWNALGLLAAIGSLLALGFALRARRTVSRCLSAASLPVLVPTLLFTYSRGASLALGLGLLAALALDVRRLQLVLGLVVAAPAAVAAYAGSRSSALTRVGSTLGAATSEGHRLALLVGVLALASAALALAFARLEARLRVAPAARRAAAATVAVAAAAVVAVALGRHGGPVAVADGAYRSFTSPPVHVGEGTSLNRRLLSLSSNGRIDLWRFAVHDFARHPVVGSGAGTYEGFYLLHRPTSAKVRDAHGLYVETLAELGVVGLALLAATLLVPVAAAVRARRHPLVPAAFGAYATFLVHAGVDWDWEVTGVTLAGLLAGAALVLAARDDAERRPTPLPVRAALAALAVAIGAFSFVGLIGNTALAASQRAIVDGRWRTAEAEARRALRFAPWSPHGRQYLGEAQFALGRQELGLANVRRAIRADPRDWDLWWTLALLTDGAERRRATLAALRLDPHSPELGEWIAGVGLDLHRGQSARAPAAYP